MEKDKIREFFLKSAQAKHAVGFDVLKTDADELHALEHEYMQHFAEANHKEVDGAELSGEQVPWREVLMFLQSLFMQMDSSPEEPSHKEATAFRKLAFSIIADAMAAKYAKQDNGN